MTVSSHGRRSSWSPSHSNDSSITTDFGIAAASSRRVDHEVVAVRVRERAPAVPQHRPLDRLRVRVDQQLVRVEPVPPLGSPGAVDPVAVALARADARAGSRASCGPCGGGARTGSRRRRRRRGRARRARRSPRSARSSCRCRPSSRRAETALRARVASRDPSQRATSLPPTRPPRRSAARAAPTP